MTARYLAVVDVETTGLGNNDRVVEVAVVTVEAATGEIIDEFDSLVNPMRDVGPVHVHGVTASMVSAAPTFDEVAAALGARISGAVLVAHNLTFDARMLGNEYDRLGAMLVQGDGICTLRASGQRLNLACEDHGIALGHHHRALADARATAELLRRIVGAPDLEGPARVTGLNSPLDPRTLRREALGSTDAGGILNRVVSRLRYPSSSGALVSYLDMLDWVLDDMVITETERRDLDALAGTLGLSREQLDDAHRAYVEALIVAAERDTVVTVEEQALVACVADLLNVTDIELPTTSPTSDDTFTLVPGMAVCFTGTAVIDGQQLGRHDLEAMAEVAGLIPVASVTKNVDLLVAADAQSMSGKVRKARQHGIPVMPIGQFITSIALSLP